MSPLERNRDFPLEPFVVVYIRVEDGGRAKHPVPGPSSWSVRWPVPKPRGPGTVSLVLCLLHARQQTRYCAVRTTVSALLTGRKVCVLFTSAR